MKPHAGDTPTSDVVRNNNASMIGPDEGPGDIPAFAGEKLPGTAKVSHGITDLKGQGVHTREIGSKETSVESRVRANDGEVPRREPRRVTSHGRDDSGGEERLFPVVLAEPPAEAS